MHPSTQEGGPTASQLARVPRSRTSPQDSPSGRLGGQQAGHRDPQGRAATPGAARKEEAVAETLAGFTVAVTADRRRDELVALLRRRGARVVEAPTLRIVPLQDDAGLRAATDGCLARPLDYVVATTGVGWRGWISAAEGWGLGDALLAACRSATVVTRGPKATGAIRASGLREVWSPPSEASDELLDWLCARELAGRVVAVQEHGIPAVEFAAALRERGAEVITVPVYAWAPPEDPPAVRRLIESVVRREVHAVTFTSAPAVTALLDVAAETPYWDALIDALRTEVLPVCIGPVCARPLESLGVETVWPERGRLGALVRTVVDALGRRERRELTLHGRLVVLQGNAVLVDGDVLLLAPVPAAVLRALADRPGRVLSRADLLRRAWSSGGADEHAVEMAVGRLRSALGPYSGLVQTVTKRGYRLAVDPAPGDSG
jgi:uroporphyrinogen-III synthase